MAPDEAGGRGKGVQDVTLEEECNFVCVTVDRFGLCVCICSKSGLTKNAPNKKGVYRYGMLYMPLRFFTCCKSKAVARVLLLLWAVSICCCCGRNSLLSLNASQTSISVCVWEKLHVLPIENILLLEPLL